MKRICLVIFFVIASSTAYGQQAGSAAAQRAIHQHNQRMHEQAERWRQSKKLSVLDKLPEKPRGQGECTSVLELKSGWSGYLEYWQFEVMQVIGPKDALIRMNNPDIPPLWLKGYPTEDLVDDDKVRVVGLVEVTGTAKYTTVMGVNKTVRVIQHVSKKRLEEIEAKKQEEEQAKALAASKAQAEAEASAWQERWKAESHTWTDKTGQYKIDAIYDTYLGEGKVRLLKADKSELIISLSILSEPDRRKAVAIWRATEASKGN